MSATYSHDSEKKKRKTLCACVRGRGEGGKERKANVAKCQQNAKNQGIWVKSIQGFFLQLL